MPIIFPPIPSSSPSPPDVLGQEMNLTARRWAMLCHLVGFLVLGMLSAPLVIPLIKWITKKSQHPFVDDQGKEAINFQTTMILCLCVTALVPSAGLILAALVIDALFMVTAARKAYDGYHYRYPYPLTIIRLIK